MAPHKIATLASLVKQGKNAAAIRLAKKIVAQDPRNADARYFLGLAYLAEDRPELGMMEFGMINQIGQFSQYCPEIPFRKKIAELYAKFNQTDEALKEYLILIKREPEVSDHYFQAGRLFEERRSSSKAVEYYHRAVELNPRNWEAQFNLGMLQYRNQNSGEAKQALDASIKVNPENHAAYFYLGRLLKEKQDFTAAILTFDKAQRDPAYKTRAIIEKGACYMSMNSFDKAIIELERALKVAGEAEENEILYARYFLSISRERTRDIEGALEQWEKIHAKQPNFKDVAQKLAQYQDLRQDDRVKDFLIVSQERFLEICRAIAASMGLAVQDISAIPNGCQIIAVESQSKWRNARRVPKLVRILRTPEPVDESTVRSFHEEMKSINVNRGVVISSSGFSRSAAGFVESRPVELWGKEKLKDLLIKADQG